MYDCLTDCKLAIKEKTRNITTMMTSPSTEGSLDDVVKKYVDALMAE